MIKNIPKKIKSSFENNLSINVSTVMSNETFQMLHIPINEILKDLLQKQSSRGSHPEVFCKKGSLKNFANFTGRHL